MLGEGTQCVFGERLLVGVARLAHLLETRAANIDDALKDLVGFFVAQHLVADHSDRRLGLHSHGVDDRVAHNDRLVDDLEVVVGEEAWCETIGRRDALHLYRRIRSEFFEEGHIDPVGTKCIDESRQHIGVAPDRERCFRI